MPHSRTVATASPAACALALLLLAACARAPSPRAVPAGPPAAPAWAQAYLAEGGQPFVPDTNGRLVWLGVISQELPFDEAAFYCRRLPEHGANPWRVPTVEELRGAPFERYQLPEEPVRLWTADVGQGELYRRWVVDPRTRARELKDVRHGVRLRVLCVTSRR
jgi:hypothetical protein